MTDASPDHKPGNRPTGKPDESPASGSGDLPLADANRRLETLELKLMDLELVLQQLNEVVVDQYRDIERMRRDHQRLQGRLDEALEGRPEDASAHEVPPHY